MKHFIQILVFALMLGSSKTAASQDINFSQFYDLSLLRNPSLAGIFTGDIRVTEAYRNQWQSVTTPYRTLVLGSEIKFPVSETSDDFFTVGLQVSHDVAGDSRLSKTTAMPLINFHKSVSDNSYLSAGIMAGGVQHRFDPTKLQFDDQYVNGSFNTSNPTTEIFSTNNLIYWDIAAGLSFSSVLPNDVRFFVATGIFHFNDPTIAFISSNSIKLKKKYVLNGGLSIPTGEANKLQFYGDCFMQGGNRQVQGGVMFSKNLSQTEGELSNSITGGLLYRFDDAIIPVVKLELNRFGIGVSYDINISKLTVASHSLGGAEVSLVYKDFFASRNTLFSHSKCPAF